MSAARLAAEAAFAAPLTTAVPAVPVRVVAVRRKLLQPHTVLPPPTASAEAQPAAKTPRVFRLADSPEQDRSAPVHDAPAAEPKPRRRRTSLIKRPGPVLQMAANGQRAPALATGAPHTAQTSQSSQSAPMQQLTQLQAMLAALEPLFAQIRFAQAFQIEAGCDDGDTAADRRCGGAVQESFAPVLSAA